MGQTFAGFVCKHNQPLYGVASVPRPCRGFFLTDMIDWFRHDYKARTHPTLQRILMKWDWKGIGVYWALIELLYENDGILFMDDLESHAFALRLDSTWLATFIQECKAFEISGSEITSTTVVERLDGRTDLSEKRSKAAQKRWSKAKAMQVHSKSNAIREENNREEKIREEKRAPAPASDFPTLDQCKMTAQMDGFTADQGEAYYHMRNATGWCVPRGKEGNLYPIVNWRSDMATAIRKGYVDRDMAKAKKPLFTDHDDDRPF